MQCLKVSEFADQFRRAFDGEAWHGPSVLALLKGVTAEQAAARPIPGAHTIWELTQHIRAWEGACLRRLNGDPAQLPDSEDWVDVNDHSEAAVGKDETGTGRHAQSIVGGNRRHWTIHGWTNQSWTIRRFRFQART